MTAPVAAPVHAAAKDFAALLGSFQIAEPHAEVKKESKKKENAPKPEEQQPDAAAPSPIPVPTLTKPDSLPITFALATPIPPPAPTEAAPGSEQIADAVSLQQPANPLPPALPISFAPIALPGLAPPPSPHVQAKTKAAAPSEAEPLVTLQLPLEDAPEGTPKTELAFEAKLTPAQPKPSAQPSSTPQSVAPVQPEATREDPKTPNKQQSQETKPIEPATPATHTTPPHPVEPASKPVDTPTAPVPTTNIEKSAASSRAPETSAPPTASASDLPELPALRTEPARDISFRIASATSDAIDVKLVDRAGQIHVAVRSSDPVLTQSLQANVSDLAGKLDRAGFQAETLVPNRAAPVHQPQQNSAFQDSQQDRRAPQQDFQPRKKRAPAPATTFTLNPHQENS